MGLSTAHAEVFVAPQGNDQNEGTREKPFGSLTRARDAVRALPPDRKYIVVRGGPYFDVTLTLTPQDSGLTIEAAPGEKPILYGGIKIHGWEKEGDHLFSAPLPPGQEHAEVRLLEVDGRMAARARFPAEGTLTHENKFNVRWMSTTGGGWQRKPTPKELTTLRYKTGDLGDWLDVKNAEITLYHMWDESCVGLAAHDSSTRTLQLASPSGHPAGAFGIKEYVIWNIREGLTAPGQWLHDRTRNRLVYWPLPNQDPNQVTMIAATHESILRLQGSPNEPVTNITVRGLGFSATTVPLRAAGFASSGFDGAISLEYANSCTFENLTVTHAAGHAINTKLDCNHIKVLDCIIAECGAGGLYVGGKSNLIENNLVHHIGLSYPSAIGIYRGGHDSVVRHNEIHHTPYSAINFGGESNVVEYNLIYNCMTVLHDGAAIYMFAAKNCILRGNLARDIIATGNDGASAYYLDELSEGCLVEGNLSLRVRWPFHNHMATKNTIQNNVAIVEGNAKLSFPRSSGYILRGNVIYASGKIRIEGIEAVSTWTNNLLFSQSGKIERAHLNDYATHSIETGPPENTQTTDPLFTDWKKGNFTYQPGSPARALGLDSFNATIAGRR